MDRESQALQEKVRILAQDVDHSRLDSAIINYVKSRRKFPYDDLSDLEELESALAGAGLGTSIQAYAQAVKTARMQRQSLLADDLKILGTFHRVLNIVWAFARERLPVRREDPRIVLATPLDILMPDDNDRRRLVDEIRALIAGPRDGRRTFYYYNSPRSLVDLAMREVGERPRKSNVPPRVFSGSTSVTGEQLVRLWEITQYVLNAISQSDPEELLAETLDASVTSEHGLRRQELAAEFGLTLTRRDHRVLSSLGRLVLWIWYQDSLLQEREHKLVTRSRDISRLTPEALSDRFEFHQRAPLTAAAQSELELDVRALCHAYKDRPALLAQVLAPLAIWHDSHDSPALLQAVDSLHQRDRDMFWRLAQALLEHPDQRVVDMVGEAVEHAERAEEQEPHDILAGLAEIVEEIAGVPISEVRLESYFAEDLDIDSLSMVEIAVAAQDKFGVEVPDETLRFIRTVGDFVNVIRQELEPQARA